MKLFIHIEDKVCHLGAATKETPLLHAQWCIQNNVRVSNRNTPTRRTKGSFSDYKYKD